MNTLAAIVLTGNVFVSFFIWIIVAGIVYWLLTWALGQIGLPEPFAKIANILLVLLVVIMVINAVLTLVGSPFISFG